MESTSQCGGQEHELLSEYLGQTPELVNELNPVGAAQIDCLDFKVEQRRFEMMEIDHAAWEPPRSYVRKYCEKKRSST